MFLLNSRLGLFSAAASLQHPFSRSYGAFLPSSLTRVLPFVLGSSPCLPVSVCGTGASVLFSSFSRQCELNRFATLISLRIKAQIPGARSLLRPILAPCTGLTITPLGLSSCVTASYIVPSAVQEFPPALHRLRLSVLGLGPDLPWADEPSPGNLRLSTGKFLACLSLLIPAFSLV